MKTVKTVVVLIFAALILQTQVGCSTRSDAALPEISQAPRRNKAEVARQPTSLPTDADEEVSIPCEEEASRSCDEQEVALLDRERDPHFVRGCSVEALKLTLELRAGGPLVSRLEEGARVEQGDRIAAVDTSELDAEIAVKEAELSLMELRVVELTPRLIQKTQAILENSEAKLAEAEAIDRRARGAVAMGDFRQIRNEITLSGIELEMAQGKPNIDEAEIDVLRKQIALLKIRREQHFLNAPRAGLIATKLPEIGETVQANEAVTQLFVPDAFEVRGHVKYALLYEEFKGMEVEIYYPGESEPVAIGTAQYLDFQMSSSIEDQRFVVRVDEFNLNGQRLRPGRDCDLKFSKPVRELPVDVPRRKARRS